LDLIQRGLFVGKLRQGYPLLDRHFSIYQFDFVSQRLLLKGIQLSLHLGYLLLDRGARNILI